MARTFGRGERAVVAVHGSSCEVPFGSRIAIVGPSGSGKSTMLHMMAGLETPTAGRVSWPGLAATEPERRGQIGVVFQSPSLVPALTVAENVALPLVLAGLPDAEAQERVTEALELVQVSELATQLPEELSGGQAQRVAVARVLASRPSLILADEPTGQLDRANGQHLVDVLLATAEELDAALVVSTHDIEVADRLQERWRMHEGRLNTDEAWRNQSRAPRGARAGATTAGGRR
ncbi:ABC transporter ATP-binding protein [Terrabacter aerolatus]|uniref:ABC transporter ATP-binding protein n=1 Tax=Terrabacter aerolatus TaxID=422442 RepID=UPI0031D68EA3